MGDRDYPEPAPTQPVPADRHAAYQGSFSGSTDVADLIKYTLHAQDPADTFRELCRKIDGMVDETQRGLLAALERAGLVQERYRAAAANTVLRRCARCQNFYYEKDNGKTACQMEHAPYTVHTLRDGRQLFEYRCCGRWKEEPISTDKKCPHGRHTTQPQAGGAQGSRAVAKAERRG